MAGSRPTMPRRREVRRGFARPRTGWWIWLRQRTVVWAVLYATVMAAAATIIQVTFDASPRVYPGQFVAQAIVPRVEFQAVDEYATRRNREDARDREPAVYRANAAMLNPLRSRLNGLLQVGREYASPEQIPVDTRNALALDQPDALAELKRLDRDDASRQQWQQMVDRFIEGVASIAMLDEERARIERDSADRARGIVMVHPTLGVLPTRADELILGMNDADMPHFRSRVTEFARAFPGPLQRTVIAVVMGNPQPTYLLDRDETNRRRQSRYEMTAPVKTTYRPIDVLIPAGTRLSQVDIALLNAEHQAFAAQLSARRFARAIPGDVALRAGQFGVFLAISLVLWGYVLAYAQRIGRNPTRGLALAALLIICQLLAIGGFSLWPQYQFVTLLAPTLTAAIVLAIAYDQRLALAIGALHTLMILANLPDAGPAVITLIVGMAVAVSQLVEVRNRSKLVWVGVMTGLAMGAAAMLVGLADPALIYFGRVSQLVRDITLAIAAGVGVGIFVQGVMPAIEVIFKVTTSMTLKELNDASHPLLRRLAEDAPGTYQHSLRIADMAEAAADAIGADGLLARVGSMYHDIGKVNKPAYFVENQGGGPNRHAKLSPAMSLLVIVGHVKDGIEMAREFGLPVVIRQFIESHHGTTLVEYFYHAAKQRKEAENAPAPAEFDYRYPGPKPQTREAAILMICDGVEGASRALPEPTPIRLEQLVHTMTMKRLMDGQFDECGITLAELHRVEEAITRTLCAIYHGRIAYPGGKDKDRDPARDRRTIPAADTDADEPPATAVS